MLLKPSFGEVGQKVEKKDATIIEYFQSVFEKNKIDFIKSQQFWQIVDKNTTDYDHWFVYELL